MLESYEEVPDRILRFYKDHPEGSLRCERMEFMELPMVVRETNPQTGELTESVEIRLHVIYHALAYRSPEDTKPGQGKASEPIPGLTAYTKGSEIMNAETSAWGRALAALGYVGKKVASANEVAARTGEFSSGRPMASEAQIKLIGRLVKQKKVTDEQRNLIFARLGIPEGTHANELTGGKDGQAWALISFLKDNPIPTGESDVPSDTGESDVPSDTGEFEPVQAEFQGGDPVPFDEDAKEST